MKIYKKVVMDIVSGKTLYEDSYEYRGRVDLCFAGGATSTDYPDWVEDGWKELWGFAGNDAQDIDQTVIDTVNEAFTDAGGNPYQGESAYIPDGFLSIMENVYNNYKLFVDALDQETDWDAMITKAVAEIDTNLSWTDINSAIATIVTDALSTGASVASGAATAAASVLNNAAITAAVTAFEAANLSRHLRGVARLSAGYSDINSVAGSAYVWAMAAAEFEFSKETTDFSAKLNLEAYNGSFRAYVEAFVQKLRDHIMSRNTYDTIRMQSISQGVAEMAKELQVIVAAEKDKVLTQYDRAKTSMIVLKEQDERDLEIDVADAKWDQTVIQFAGNIMGNLAGGTAGVQGSNPTKAQSAVGGAMTGAAAGYMIGNVPGAIIGGLAGLIGGAAS